MDDDRGKTPTQRQLGLIARIESATGVPFEGATGMDASVYIDENIDDCRLVEEAGRR